MPQIQTTISPIDQQPVLTRPLLTDDQLDHVVAESVRAYKGWRKVTLDDRLAIAEKWMVGPSSRTSRVYADECLVDRV